MLSRPRIFEGQDLPLAKGLEREESVKWPEVIDKRWMCGTWFWVIWRLVP
jgi:hypothetical protein